jgi:hypothetical protein
MVPSAVAVVNIIKLVDAKLPYPELIDLRFAAWIDPGNSSFV